ncbi:hypothetical protein [Variovorax sp. SRS16]|uniref:hypothetical protein n=1 Tax=Variovorax sp. SRS16 TaxID=282217 RepID=UPI0013A56134|nr:hypothetical protein [Variovorax sp. SRS16]
MKLTSALADFLFDPHALISRRGAVSMARRPLQTDLGRTGPPSWISASNLLALITNSHFTATA